MSVRSRLTFFLVVLAIAIAPHAAMPTEKPRLTAERVLALADAALARSAASARRFKPRTPNYRSDRKVWWVFYAETGTTVMVDGDELVVVDDRTSDTCVQQAIAVGPCT